MRSSARRVCVAFRTATNAAAALAMSTAAATATGPPPLLEDFDDNAIGPSWTSFATNPDVLEVQEANQRLEFPVDGAGLGSCLDPPYDGAVIVQSGLVADGWVIDYYQDFRIRVDFHANVPKGPPPFSSADLSLDLVYAADGSTITRGLRFVFGSYVDGPCVIFSPFPWFVRVYDGDMIIFQTSTRIITSGTFYLWYDAAGDDLRWSFEQFDDPSFGGQLGLRNEAAASRFQIILRGTVQLADGQLVDTYEGSDLHLDNLVIEEGGLIDTSCLADADGSGTVGATDLLGLLAAWGTNDPGHDIAPAPQGDATVDLADLLALLASWGPCP